MTVPVETIAEIDEIDDEWIAFKMRLRNVSRALVARFFFKLGIRSVYFGMWCGDVGERWLR